MLQDNYIHQFGSEGVNQCNHDEAFNAFSKMISPKRMQPEREEIFTRLWKKITGIALDKDLVIPYHVVEEAMGRENMEKNIQLIDFSFHYTPKNPFLFNLRDMTAVNRHSITSFHGLRHF